MAAENISWIVPIVEGAYQHRAEIAGASRWFYNWMTRSRQHIMFTGMTGVGKTVLFDFISGKGFQKGYLAPPQSQKPESGKVLFKEGKSVVTVIPGEKNAADVSDATSELVKKYGVPHGIVHVVSNGLAEVRGEIARTELAKSMPTMQAYQEATRKAEVEDLKHTIRDLIRFHDKAQRPRWMVVAVTKCDLYAEDLSTVGKQYDPSGEGPFVDLLDELKTEVGARYFRWTAIPVSCTLTPFCWREGDAENALRPTITEAQRDKMVDDFIGHLSRF